MSKTKKAVGYSPYAIPTVMKIADANITMWANKQAKKKPKKNTKIKPKKNTKIKKTKIKKTKKKTEEYKINISIWKKDMSPVDTDTVSELLVEVANFMDQHKDHKWRINSQMREEHNISAEATREELGLKIMDTHNGYLKHGGYGPICKHLGGSIFYKKYKNVGGGNLYYTFHSCGKRGGMYNVGKTTAVCTKCGKRLMSPKALKTAIELKELKAATK